MFIGIARFEVFIPASRSLKDKRQVLRSMIATTQKRFAGAAIAEVGHQDLWQRAVIGVSCVSDSKSHCSEVIQEIERYLGRFALEGAEIIDRSIDIISSEDI
jgi:uncharacterized protein YlxP (DUF503 family)